MGWTPERERQAIVQHVAGCSFCAALLAHSLRRGDRVLLDAADQLAWEHSENDAERETLSVTARQRAARAGSLAPAMAPVAAQSAGSVARIALPRSDHDA